MFSEAFDSCRVNAPRLRDTRQQDPLPLPRCSETVPVAILKNQLSFTLRGCFRSPCANLADSFPCSVVKLENDISLEFFRSGKTRPGDADCAGLRHHRRRDRDRCCKLASDRCWSRPHGMAIIRIYGNLGGFEMMAGDLLRLARFTWSRGLPYSVSSQMRPRSGQPMTRISSFGFRVFAPPYRAPLAIAARVRRQMAASNVRLQWRT